MNKSDLEKLVNIRVSEAQVLLENGNYQGAYYLIGYSLECALKVCIAKQVQQYDFPNKQLANKSHTHKLTDLLVVAELKQNLSNKENEDIDFRLNWAVAKEWSENARYECNIEATEARALFEAITETNSGVLVWLKTFW